MGKNWPEEQPSGVCLDPLGDWMAVSFPNRVDLLILKPKKRTASFRRREYSSGVGFRGLIIGDEED